MSEQHRPDPALPQNPQPSGNQGYPQQPAPAGQPMYGNAPAPAAELPEKPAYRGTVVAVLIVGIIAALVSLACLILELTVTSKFAEFARATDLDPKKDNPFDFGVRAYIGAVISIVAFIYLSYKVKYGDRSNSATLTVVAIGASAFNLFIFLPRLDDARGVQDLLQTDLIPERFVGFLNSYVYVVYLGIASVAVFALLVILTWIPPTTKYMEKAKAYYDALHGKNQPVDASALAVPASEGQAPAAQHNAQHVQNGQQGYGYDPQAPQNPQVQQNNVPQNPQNPQDHQGNSGYNLN